ncbi:TPA: nitric oxide reductase activation-like protein, partial [Clostridioides difficile]
MKWIYDDYEFENRANNLSWTIAGDYNESIDISEKDYSSKEIGLYFAIIAGARRKYVDWDIVKKYLTNRIRKGYNKDVILGLIQVILNTIVEEKVIKDRPGIEDIRRNAYKDIVSRFTKIHNDNIMDKIK